MKTNIYIDESGNTGQDLLNKDQKVFVLASNNFSQEQIESMISLFDNKSELHFKKLKDSDAGRKSIINFINHDLVTENNIMCVTAHKEFCTVGQIVDQIIEPVLYDVGIDLFKRSENIVVTNFIFYFGTFFWNKELYNNLLHSFILMVRTKTSESIEAFYSDVEKLHKSLNKEEKSLLQPVRDSKLQIINILEGVNKFTIDLTLSCFYVICDFWYKKLNKKISIFQDSSKQIEHYKEYIVFTKNLNIPIQEVGFDSKTMIFPTQIEKLELVSSESSLGVQFSDLIASSIAYMYNNKNPKQAKFVEEIKNSKLLNLNNYFTIWPSDSKTLEKFKTEKGKGENILDFLANLR